MRIKPFQAVYPNFDYITSADSFFDTVKVQYPEYKKSGFFNKTAQEAIYIYQIKTDKRVYTGLVACSDIQDFNEGNIKKHENTLSQKEQQQMHLMLSRNATVKPVLLTYPNVDKIKNLIHQTIKKNKPFYTTIMELKQQQHTFWEVSDGALIQKFQKLFEKHVPRAYIADGHHRTSTTALMSERMKNNSDGKNYDLLLSAFFAVDELEIYDYNRVVDGLNECSMTTFMAKISQVFNVEILAEARKPNKKYEVVMFLNREWFVLTWKQEVLDEYEKESVLLDASLLNEKVMKGILGIEDVRTDTRIKYIEGPKGLEALKERSIRNDSRVAFALYPVELTDLLQIADEGKTMPPKSTWFEPRMKNGLVVHEF